MSETRAPTHPETLAPKPRGAPRRRWRSCLRCRGAFKGSGPGERICEPCKETDSWRNVVAASKGFIEW